VIHPVELVAYDHDRTDLDDLLRITRLLMFVVPGVSYNVWAIYLAG